MSDTTASPKWLIFGADGMIGSHLASNALQTPARLIRTSRRRNQNSDQLYADLNDGNFSDVIAAGATVVFLCAGETNMQTCQENPERTRRINVTGTVRLASELFACGAFVIYLSSNTVFDGSSLRPEEDAPTNPVTEYGRQKADAESALLDLPGAANHLAVVRISKVISPDQGVLATFLRQLTSGKRCPAFEDLKLSPLSLPFVRHGLITIAIHRTPGIFHLSGADEFTYAEFAHMLAAGLNLDAQLVVPVLSRGCANRVHFRPAHPALGMKRTNSLLGLQHQETSQLLRDIGNASHFQ